MGLVGREGLYLYYLKRKFCEYAKYIKHLIVIGEFRPAVNILIVILYCMRLTCRTYAVMTAFTAARLVQSVISCILLVFRIRHHRSPSR